jgi:glycosyltransferase involved in cell wall biosynthesis
MAKPNILFYDDRGLLPGSISKLYLIMSKMLEDEFNIFLTYAPKYGEAMKSDYLGTRVTLIPFEFEYQSPHEPHKMVNMNPNVEQIISKYGINCVCLSVFAHYQYPINKVPASVPFVLISPFGHYCTNGNVCKTYVSGISNAKRLLKRGVKNVEPMYNPLADPAAEYLTKQPVDERVIFGRVGRPDESIFDPISVKAFKKLEELYGDKVKYVVVNAPPGWKALAAQLDIKNMDYRANLSHTDLAKVYQEIDVLAHARKDGETVGVAIAEAMLAGNPVITHRSLEHNDHFDILDPSFARWCAVNDSEQYFQNMAWMVEHKDQIRGMGQLARKRALKVFSPDIWKPKFLETFREASRHYYNNSTRGKVIGYTKLYWENFKASPFLVGKLLTYAFPSTYGKLRKLYYQ